MRAKDRSLEQWLSYIESVHFRSIDLQLDRVNAVLERLLPQGPNYDVISVAGTNGKGSAVEMISSILSHAGLSVGTYTSPHLVSYTERIRMEMIPIDEQELCAAFQHIERVRSNVPLTYFEFGTLAALFVFQQRDAEIVVLEVGMGGRLDAVNAVDSSVALVTSVAIDHQHWLGPDREAIATEKAGIFRRDQPAVCADLDPPATIASYAAQIGANLHQINRDFSFTDHQHYWDWRGPATEFAGLPVPLMPGKFQLQNAAGVVMTLMALKRRVRISQDHLRAGLLSARLRGRFEIVTGTPMVILDVAHNVAAVTGLKENLEAMGVDAKPGRTLAVCGMLRDKPVASVCRVMAPLVDGWYIGSIHDPRGCPADEISAIIQANTTNQVSSHTSVTAAFDAAVEDAGADDRVLVFGSFHTVGDIIRALETNHVEH